MDQPKRLFLSPPHMSGRERHYIDEVFDTNYIAPVGPHLQQFERLFAETVELPYAVALASGTAAIHLALRQLQLQPEDEIWCSTLTFCASANPILYEGARPVFFDSDWETWNIDPHLVEAELDAAAKRGQLPKAIIVVDLLGQSADMDAITQVADRYEVPVIEDAAEALGATYKHRPAGRSGWCSTFSFNGNKIITTSGGGMLCSHDEQLIDRARFLSTQARESVPYYQHETYGYNYRLSNVLAGIGIAQLEVLPARVAARRRISERYFEALGELPGISFMPVADFGEPNCWLTTILVDPHDFGIDCETLRQSLESHNIESRRTWKPMHQQPVFAGCRTVGGAVAEQIFEQGLSLPSGSALTEEDMQRVIDAIRAAR